MIDEVILCQCGLEKINANNRGVYVCVNCDGIQDIEVTVIATKNGEDIYGERIKSRWDIEYHLEMERRIKGWYAK